MAEVCIYNTFDIKKMRKLLFSIIYIIQKKHDLYKIYIEEIRRQNYHNFLNLIL